MGHIPYLFLAIQKLKQNFHNFSTMVQMLYYVRTFIDVHTISPCMKGIWSKTGLFLTQCDQECQYQSQLKNNTAKTCKTHLWVVNPKYFIMLGPLWSCTYDFSMFQGIWSKTGSFWKRFDQKCQYQSQP